MAINSLVTAVQMARCGAAAIFVGNVETFDEVMD
jgi:molybdopterin synthase catalytic subunit